MNKELSKAWLLSALADLKTMEHLLEDEFLAHVVAFHGQQCVEKSFKAILENAHKRVPKEHYPFVNDITRSKPGSFMLGTGTGSPGTYFSNRFLHQKK